MYKDLGIKDRLNVINTGVKTGKTPALAVYLYNQSLNGGYNEWLKEMSKRLGVDVSKDPRYYYKLFYDNNPENAWDLLEGKTDGSVLEQYKNKEYEKLMLLQGQLRKSAITINDLMDYSLFEKLINNYMNQSINVHAYGGPVNIYAEGTNNLNPKIDEEDLNLTRMGTTGMVSTNNGTVIDEITITPEIYRKYLQGRIMLDNSVRQDEDRPIEYRNLPDIALLPIKKKELLALIPGFDTELDNVYYYVYLDKNGNPIMKTDENGNVLGIAAYNLGSHKEINRGVAQFKLEQHDAIYWANRRLSDGTYLVDGIEVTPDSNNNNVEPIPVPTESNIHVYDFGDNPTPPKEKDRNDNNLIEGEGSGGHSNNGTGQALAPAAGYSSDAPVYYQEPFLIDWSMPLFEAYPITGINWPETEKQYLLPPGYVQIPNHNVQQITDNGPDQGLNFRDFLFNLVGYTDSSFRDALMAQMMLPKDYFSDPYAGLNYTNTILGNAGFNNDPYTQIQRESNGTPLYANGGPVNLFAGGGYNVNAYRRQHRQLLARQNRSRRQQSRSSGENINAYRQLHKRLLNRSTRSYSQPTQQSSNANIDPNLLGILNWMESAGPPPNFINYNPSDNTRVATPPKVAAQLNVEANKRRLREITRNTAILNAAYATYGADPLTREMEISRAESNPEQYMQNWERERAYRNNMTFLNPDNRSDWERNEGLLIFNNRWRIEDLRRLEAEADEAIMHMLKPLSPSTWIGAVGRAAKSNDGFLRTANNFIGDLTYNDENVGIASAFGKAGERWAATHPILNLGLNLSTDIATAKALGAIGRLSNFRFRIPINENFYYRLGRGLALDAIDSGVIRSGVDPLTGTQQYIHPYFSKGRLHYGNSPRYDVIVNTGKGKYNWEGLNGADQIVPGGKMTVSGYNGRGTMTIDPGFRTPLVDGKPNLASTTDFDLYVPINKRIFGRDVNLGYWKKSLGQSNPEPSFLLPSQEEAAFSYDPITGYRYTGYQQPNFSLSSPIKPKDINVGPADLFPLPTKPIPELTTNDIVDLPYFITQDNRAITPEKWDKLFYDAVSRNDTKMIQNLRDYHFIELALNNNLLFPTFDTYNPATLKHVVADLYNPNFNIFNPTIEGTNSFIYTTDSAPMASSYFSKPITVQDVAKFRDYYGNLWKKGLQQRLDGFRKTLADIQEAENNGFQTLADYYKSMNKRGYLPYSPSNNLPLTKSRMIFEQNFNSTLNDLVNFLEYLNNQLAKRGFDMPNPERMKTLYGALNNPVILDADNGFWSNIGNYNIEGTLYRTGSTRDVEHNIMRYHPDVDGFIINKVRDYGGRRQFGDWDPAGVIGFRYPNLLKYKAGITYDDNGTIIPLSKRDNFEIGDLRFSKGGSLKISK